MNFDFELILFYATLITGAIGLLDILFFAPRRAKTKKMPIIIEYSRSFFPVLLIVFLLRSFLYEPFRIPTGSLEPSLLKGDFILVNKFDYGLRLPILHTKIFANQAPQRGDIMIFRWPPDPSFNFIKRVIGLPGDHISYINKEVYVNGKKSPQTTLGMTTATDESYQPWQAQEKTENLLGVNHLIYIDPERSGLDYKEVIVPAGMYFVMGDNRDYSADSRYWGFVPEENIVGKAVFIWMSWNKKTYLPRWDRIGSKIH